MLHSIAYAQEGAAPVQNMLGNFSAFLPIILLFAVVYFLMIRPQQKRQRQLNETLNALKTGDQIVTTSGIIGTVDSVVDGNTFLINIGGGVKVQILRSGIAGKMDHGKPVAQEKK